MAGVGNGKDNHHPSAIGCAAFAERESSSSLPLGTSGAWLCSAWNEKREKEKKGSHVPIRVSLLILEARINFSLILPEEEVHWNFIQVSC